MITVLGEKNNVCGLCYLYSKKLGVCLLTGEEVAYGDKCSKWMAFDVCPECMIDFKGKESINEL